MLKLRELRISPPNRQSRPPRRSWVCSRQASWVGSHERFSHNKNSLYALCKFCDFIIHLCASDSELPCHSAIELDGRRVEIWIWNVTLRGVDKLWSVVSASTSLTAWVIAFDSNLMFTLWLEKEISFFSHTQCGKICVNLALMSWKMSVKLGTSIAILFSRSRIPIIAKKKSIRVFWKEVYNSQHRLRRAVQLANSQALWLPHRKKKLSIVGTFLMFHNYDKERDDLSHNELWLGP